MNDARRAVARWAGVALVWLCATGAQAATTYHLDSAGGSDEATGKGETQAWRSLQRLGQASLRTGDTVLFKRGGVWTGTLQVDSGVTYAAYGSGAAPVISGARELGQGAWTRYQGNVYTLPLDLPSTQAPSQLYLEDNPGKVVRLQRARYPNIGKGAFGAGSRYLRLAGGDDQGRAMEVEPGALPADADLSQAEAYVRNDLWVLTRYTVEEARGRRLGVKPTGPEVLPIRAGWGYWLENALWMLDSPGEWVYDRRKRTLYVWMPDGRSPAGRPLRAAVAPQAIMADQASGFTLKDLAVQESAADAVRITGANRGFVIDGLTVQRAGARGIYVTASRGGSITRTTVTDTVENGISLGDFRFMPHVTPSKDVDISQCVVRNAGMGYYAHSAITLGDGGALEGCRIENASYLAVTAWKGNRIKGNTIVGACLAFDDCGAIYTISRQGSRRGYPLDVGIIDNIVMGSVGGGVSPDAPRLDGQPYARAHTETRGIYLDDDSTSVSIKGNVVSGYDHGIMLHLATENTVSGNTVHGNRVSQLWMQQNDADHPVRDNTISDNTWLSGGGATLLTLTNNHGGTQRFASFAGNRYLSQGGAQQPVRSETNQGTEAYTLAQWRDAVAEKRGAYMQWALRMKAGGGAPPSLIQGQFDGGTQGWASWAVQLSPTSSGCRAGGCVLVQPEGSQRQPNGTPFGIFNTTQPLAVQQGQQYLVSFDARPQQAGASIDLVLRNPATNYSDVSSHQALQLTPGAWQSYQGVLSATATVAQGARLDLVVASPSGGVLIDNVKLVPMGGAGSAGAAAPQQEQVRVLTNTEAQAKTYACPDSGDRCDRFIDVRSRAKVVFPLKLQPRETRVVAIDEGATTP